jgi:protein SCO1/2
MAHASPASPTLERLVWGIVGLAAGVVIGAFLYARLGPRLSGSGTEAPPLPVLANVTGFALTNHAGLEVSATDLRGQPWLGAIIFTRCPGPCVRVTRNLVALQNRLLPESGLRFVVLTADPQFDTPTVLREYGERFGADFRRWHFLTGPQLALYTVATQQLLLAVAENPDPTNAAPQDLFIHSTKVVLVDRAGRVRGAYDGEEPAAGEQILADVRRLEREAP